MTATFMFARLLWCCVGVGGVMSACEGCSDPSNTRPASSPFIDEAGDAPMDAMTDIADAAPDAEGCHPGDVSGFVPPSGVPDAAISLACNGQNGDGGLVPSYGDACLGVSATYDSCTGFAAAEGGSAAACYACLVKPAREIASSYAVVVAAAIPVVNYSGCIETLDPTAAGKSCAVTFAATASCADYACKPTCPVLDETSFSAYVTCTNEALYGACAGYTLESIACLAAEEGDGGTPVASTCFAGATAEDHYLSIAHFICGGG